MSCAACKRSARTRARARAFRRWPHGRRCARAFSHSPPRFPRSPPLARRSYGERFELGRHPQGTEVKAITYSNMQIITPRGTLTSNSDGGGDVGGGGGGGGGAEDSASLLPIAGSFSSVASKAGAPYEVFVIIDI